MEKKQKKKILILILAILGLSLGAFLIPERQTVREKAAFGGVNLRLDPAAAAKNVNEEFNVAIRIEAGSYKISGIDLKLNYDKNQLTVIKFNINAEKFNTDLLTDLGSTTGRVRLVVLNTGQDLATGTFRLGSIKMKAKRLSGQTPFRITIDKAATLIVGKGPAEDVALLVDQTTDGSYTIVEGEIPSPTPTATPTGPTPTPTLTPTLAPTPTPTLTPTLTPIPTVTPSATPTVTLVVIPVLNFKVKFQGVNSKRADQKVKVKLVKGSFNKTFDDVLVSADNNGIYSGLVALQGISPGSGYTIYIKGPKHLARKFCVDSQASRCQGTGNLTISAGSALNANNFDFSKIVLESGDLPNPDNNLKQDGVVNSLDYSLWKARVGKEDETSLKVADVNFDGVVNQIDWQLMKITLETKYEEE